MILKAKTVYELARNKPITILDFEKILLDDLMQKMSQLITKFINKIPKKEKSCRLI